MAKCNKGFWGDQPHQCGNRMFMFKFVAEGLIDGIKWQIHILIHVALIQPSLNWQSTSQTQTQVVTHLAINLAQQRLTLMCQSPAESKLFSHIYNWISWLTHRKSFISYDSLRGNESQMSLLATGVVLWLTYIFSVLNLTIDPKNNKFSETLIRHALLKYFNLHGETRKIYKLPINYTTYWYISAHNFHCCRLWLH
jgi:hypothetical protein